MRRSFETQEFKVNDVKTSIMEVSDMIQVVDLIFEDIRGEMVDISLKYLAPPKAFSNSRVYPYHQNLDFYFGTTFGHKPTNIAIFKPKY